MNSEDNYWGRLIPLNNTQALPTYHLTRPITTIGRNPDCHICINDKRLSGKHCTVTIQNNHGLVLDLSTNGTFIADKLIGKGNSSTIMHTNEIWLLTASKVPVNQTIGFRLQVQAVIEQQRKKEEQAKIKLAQEKQIQIKKREQQQRRRQQQARIRQQQAKIRQQEQKKQKQIQSKDRALAQKLKDQITCTFCFEIISIPVAVQPCNHRFCGGCLTQLINHKKQQCIQCRKKITSAVRDASFNGIIDDYLKTHPEEKRDPRIEEQLKKKNIFGFDPLDVHELIHGKPQKKKAQRPQALRVPPERNFFRARPRAVVDSSEESSQEEIPMNANVCAQCRVPRNGFRCALGQLHVACHTCGKRMPQRDIPALHQSCAICTTYYCNLYMAPCRPGSKLICIPDRKNTVRIDSQLFRGNKFQFQILRDYLTTQGMNANDVFTHMLQKMTEGSFSYIIDRKIMRIAPLVPKQIKLDGDEAICDLCWPDLWFQMVFEYRLRVASMLPFNVRHRPICYYGINCRTMDHKADHAKRYNHCLYQSKFQ